MKEIDAIIRKYDEWASAGKNMALATVVQVDGSSYRRPGARMLVCDDGSHIGAVSGGCLDSDVIKKALAVMDSGQPMLYTYDNMEEDELTDRARVGCNGVVYVLIEGLSGPENDHHIAMLRHAANHRKPFVLVTSFNPSVRRQGETFCRYLCDETGLVLPLSADLPPGLADTVKNTLAAQKSLALLPSENSLSTNQFCEYLKPPVRLVIAGSGQDVYPMVQIAAVLGWQTILVDGKATNKLSAFTSAGCRVIPSKPEEVMQRLKPDDTTVFVLMTHNYGYDKELLSTLCSHGVKHIALLGPAKKYEKLKNELALEGRALSGDQAEIVCCPAGLNIGATSPEEIALSIIAEIRAVLSNTNGHQLKNKSVAIHT